MSKNIMELQSDSEDCIREFSKACDEIMRSKYILADKKISDVMRVIASYKLLYELFETVLKDFDYGLELAKAKVINSYNHNSLKLPSDRGRSAALIFCILLDFDTARRELKDFLHEFFYDESGPNEEYAAFCEQVIAPFKKNVEILYLDAEGGEVRQAEDFFDGQPEFHLGSVEIERLVSSMREMIHMISRDVSVSIAEKEEMLTVCEGLSNTLYTKNVKLIKIMYIGCKNTLRLSPVYRTVEPYLEDFSQLLKEYKII